jgi:hypothetical protein
LKTLISDCKIHLEKSRIFILNHFNLIDKYGVEKVENLLHTIIYNIPLKFNFFLKKIYYFFFNFLDLNEDNNFWEFLEIKNNFLWTETQLFLFNNNFLEKNFIFNFELLKSNL